MPRKLWPRRYSRLPIRARLTVAFFGVMTVVLAAAGLFLYAQFRSDLGAQIDNSLKLEAQDVEALVDAGGPHSVAVSGEPFAQVFATDGALLTTTRKPAGYRLLSVARAITATQRPQPLTTEQFPFGPARVLAMPANPGEGQRLALAVAEPLRLRDHELS